MAATAAAGLGEGHIQPEGEIGLKTACCETFHRVDQGQGQAPAIALIGGCRSGEAITKHPISGLQRRQQERFDMLGTVGCIKKQFGPGQGLHPLGRMQQ